MTRVTMALMSLSRKDMIDLATITVAAFAFAAMVFTVSYATVLGDPRGVIVDAPAPR